MKVIIVGGVAAGMSAASKIKRIRYDAEIMVYEKGSTLSYGACGMPYFISNEIKDINKLIARSEEAFNKIGIGTRLYHEVVAVDPSSKRVTVRDIINNKIFEDSYDKLLISTGARPIVPSWPGVESSRTRVLSSLEDATRIKEEMMSDDIRDVVIIGAGFIGVELTESARMLGKRTTLIEYKNQILPHLDKEMSEHLKEELVRRDVSIRVSEKVEEIIDKGDRAQVVTNKNYYDSDMIIICVGVKPNTDFLEQTDIEMDRNGALILEKDMKTSITDIYGAGDCGCIYNRVKDKIDDYIPLGTNANKQGKLAGMSIAGERVRHVGALGTSMIKVFDMEAAKTGVSEREAIAENFNYKSVVVKTLNHASYYPDPMPIWIKLCVDKKTNRILGAQSVGYRGAALRINTLALAIHTGITVDELNWLDFGYAPPFSGVWDSIHLACSAIK